ncbi:MAG: hypothetical protein KAH22_03515 [Thiotrichaceae bacterium]|nr:hypothetical protein [Thiotrichaceae bacterium]
MYKLLAVSLATSLLLIASVTNAAPPSGNKAETIIVEGKGGVLKEKRIKSVQSKISFTPNVMAPYDIIPIGDDGTDDFNQHTDGDSLSIPTWTLFSW